MAAAAPTTLMSLTCAPSLLQGLCSPPRSFHLTNKKRPRKAGSTMVKAMLELKPPPYPLDALEPHMSKETLEYHWGEHHSGYVKNLNEQIAETELDGKSLEDIIITSYNKGDILPAFNNAAQVWNHDFFWESMKPGGGGKPSGELLELIERDFGSFEKFVEKFKSTAATQFGSGWAWLAYKATRLEVGNGENPRPSEEDKKLVVVKSPNAVNPLVWDYYPLLAIDVWEHAYYLDFENRRVDYASIFLEKLVSWEIVSSRLESAKAQHAAREIARELAIENAARVQVNGQQAEELENAPGNQADGQEAEQSGKDEQVTERISSDSDDSEEDSVEDSEEDSVEDSEEDSVEDSVDYTEDDSENE